MSTLPRLLNECTEKSLNELRQQYRRNPPRSNKVLFDFVFDIFTIPGFFAPRAWSTENWLFPRSPVFPEGFDGKASLQKASSSSILYRHGSIQNYNDLQAALSSRAQEAEQICFFDVACLRSQLLLAMIRQISCEFETPQGAVDQLTSEDKPCARCWALEGSRWNVAPWRDQGKNRTPSEACSNLCWARAAFVHPRVAHTLWRAHRDFVDLLQSLLLVPQTRTDSEVAIWAAGCRTSLTSLA
ncbi:predicted protein [Histoplasma capsulatum var. duboisii H88]|uniref:Predicted protein n=1 Tax=Ajellomyces capsulatus (strain H88) TaxID=544711 RepID=F0UJ55_AJEC8|nr:predicted protein [Histoplasma capsulatum var. duboisii H88]